MILSGFYKASLTAFVCCAIVFGAFGMSFGQETSDAPKDEIQVIKGKKYTIHTVVKKETLYSLSKKYGVSIEEIQNTNPEIAEKGLKLGMQVKFPVTAAIVKPAETKTSTATSEKAPGVPKTQPGTAGTKPVTQDKSGTPSEKPATTKPITTPGKTPVASTKPAEATASETSNIPASIASLPPLLYTKPKKNGAAKDSVKAEPAQQITVVAPAIQNEMPLALSPFSNDTIYGDTLLIKPNKNYALDEYTIALLLPLHLYAETSHSVKKSENKDKNKKEEEPATQSPETISQSSLMGLEFYEGVKMAADSLEKEGLKAKIRVYDTSGDTNVVKQILLKPELKSAQLIIGPLSPLASINKVAKFAKENSIAMVSPVVNVEKVISENPYVINCTPSPKTQCRKMSEFIVDSFATANIIIVQASSPKEIDLANNFKQALATLFKGQGILDAKVRTIKYSEKGLTGVREALSATGKNLIIIPSSEEGFISMLLTGLKSQVQKYDISLVGLPTWQKFETIDAGIFQELNTYIFNAYHINYDDPAIVKFRLKYRDMYKSEPSDHVYHGFDTGYYYLKSLMTFGKGFTEILPELNYTTMHTVFEFERKGPKGGFENTYISVLKYENYQLKKLNK